MDRDIGGRKTMSAATPTPLGILRPLGGGDPIPLKKEELIVGRRPTTDIQLDFENVSGKHCVLKFIKGVWHVRDLGSTNGTTVNGQAIRSEHGIMPDDELGIANHFFSIDYEPIAPTSLLSANQVLEEEMAESSRKKPSLLELAGIESEDRPRHRPRPERAPIERVVRPLSRDAEFEEDAPDSLAATHNVEASDEDFFRMIQGDLEPEKPANKKR
jgi:pSer/pThr/pTyr-binding forkhead associated (FHA) protein